MSTWNPWRGCRKCSEGCFHCYIHKGDAKRGVNTNEIVKTKDFFKPVEKLKNGNYKMKAGTVYLFSPNVSFEFRQCGTHFIKDGKEYKLQTKDLFSQARKAGINFQAHR